MTNTSLVKVQGQFTVSVGQLQLAQFKKNPEKNVLKVTRTMNL
jgi:hypothetical protein